MQMKRLISQLFSLYLHVVNQVIDFSGSNRRNVRHLARMLENKRQIKQHEDHSVDELHFHVWITEANRVKCYHSSALMQITLSVPMPRAAAPFLMEKWL